MSNFTDKQEKEVLSISGDIQNKKEEMNELPKQQDGPIKSNILSSLFKEVNKEKFSPDKEVNPKGHYVRGAHTEGVYHKHYNRY